MSTKKTSADVREAAVVACSALLFRSGLDKGKAAQRYILNRALNELVWCFSGNHEQPGKHLGCPWWTERAYSVFASDENWRSHVALDHVVERKELIQQLLESDSEESVRKTLFRSETCVVMHEEHKALPKGTGWARYAGIKLVPGPKTRVSLTGAWPTPPNEE